LELELLTLWRQLLQNDSLGIDDDLFESGGDSLIATQVILEIERMVGHPVNPSILLEAPTIRTLVLNLGSQAELQSDSVIHLHASGDRSPFLSSTVDLASPTTLDGWHHISALINPS